MAPVEAHYSAAKVTEECPSYHLRIPPSPTMAYLAQGSMVELHF